VLAFAAFIVYAVQYSDFGNGGATTARLEGTPPPQASPIAVRLANAVGRASLGRRFHGVDMAAVAPLAWDRLYVFRDETAADIRRRLGFAWAGAPATVPRGGEHESLLAFTRGARVVRSAFFSDAIGHLDCLSAPAGYPRGTRFEVRFARNHHDPYLASAPPGAAEAACLRAVGA
jgi:hypothetical protein